MFESKQSIVSELLRDNDMFRRLYDKHADLNVRVDNAVAGKEAMDDMTLEALKREKLHLADRLQTMVNDHVVQ